MHSKPRLLFKLFVMSMCLSPFLGWAQGLKFYNGNWDALLAEAKKQNKPFFVDFYTDWCGPCKMMSRKTFTDGQVGTYGNTHFISYKTNAEQGEGEVLAVRYRIEGYPTIVFFNANGNEIGRWIGYADGPEFLRVLQKYQAMNAAVNAHGQAGPKTMKTIPHSQRKSLSALFE